jgi:acetylornithine deacetylase/succinyl-diaminopimelate desuccinylase-like protein
VTDPIRDEMAALTLQLCSIPSETCHEAEIATWIQHRCIQAAGADAVKRVGHTVIW